MKAVDRAIVFFLSMIFLFSGIDKILHYEGFVNALRDYVLVPRGTAPYFALPVIAVELLVGVGLVLKGTRAAAALTAAVTLAAFTVAVAVNHQFGNRGICGCWFTITLAQGTGMHLMQNLLFLGLALTAWNDSRVSRTAPPSGLQTTIQPEQGGLS